MNQSEEYKANKESAETDKSEGEGISRKKEQSIVSNSAKCSGR